MIKPGIFAPGASSLESESEKTPQPLQLSNRSSHFGLRPQQRLQRFAPYPLAALRTLRPLPAIEVRLSTGAIWWSESLAHQGMQHFFYSIMALHKHLHTKARESLGVAEVGHGQRRRENLYWQEFGEKLRTASVRLLQRRVVRLRLHVCYLGLALTAEKANKAAKEKAIGRVKRRCLSGLTEQWSALRQPLPGAPKIYVASPRGKTEEQIKLAYAIDLKRE